MSRGRNGQAEVRIVGDESQAVAALKRLNASGAAAAKQFDRDFGKISQVAASVATRFMALGAAAAAGAGLATRAASEAEQAWARLGAMVRVNAGAVGRSFEEMQAMVESIRATTLFDRAEIEQSISQLLTYKDISGSTFERTIDLATDLATVFGSLQGSTAALAKALDDPIRGLGDLRRQGFTFTAEVENQIRVLMEQNKLFDAQRIILNTLEGEVSSVSRAMKTGIAGWADDIKKGSTDALVAIGNWISSFGALERGADGATSRLKILTETLNAHTEARKAYDRAVASNQELSDLRHRETIQQVAPGFFRQPTDMDRVRAALPGLAQSEADAERERARQAELDAENARVKAAEAAEAAAKEVQRNLERAAGILANMRFQERYGYREPMPDPSLHVARIPGIIQPGRIGDTEGVRQLRLQENERTRARAYENRLQLEAMDPARVATRTIQELERAERAAQRMGDTLVDAIMSGTGAAKSLALAAGREALSRGGSDVIGWATAGARGRAAQAAARAKGATDAQAGAAGAEASAAATAAGPAGLAMAAAGLALTLGTSLFGRRSEESNYRAHLRALREARRDEVVINLHLPGGVIDTTNPVWREAVNNTLVTLSGDRVGRLNVVS